MTDDGIGRILILVEEVCHAREGNLVDVLVYFLSCHSDTTVADGQCAFVSIERDMHGQVTQIPVEIAFFFQCLQLLGSVNGIAHHLAEENLMIRIEKLFDDGEDVLCRNPDITFLHNLNVIKFLPFTLAKSVPKQEMT